LGPTSAHDLVRLTEQKFDDPKQAIPALHFALETEARLDDWPLAEDRGVIRGRLLLRLGQQRLETRYMVGANEVIERTRPDSYANLLAWEDLRRASDELADKDPIFWAEAQHTLARVYFWRCHGIWARNIENMIATCEAALTVRTAQAFPVDWAKTQSVLAIAYRSRVCGQPAENVERAIALSNAALTVLSREAFPQEWAEAQANLGAAYLVPNRGELAERSERAIAYLEAALTVYTREAFPIEWAMAQKNLAVAYSVRIQGERADNLESTIALFEATQPVLTREAFPIEWAQVKIALALAYVRRIRGARIENIERAIAQLNTSIGVLGSQALPDDRAMGYRDLARAYIDLLREPNANIYRTLVDADRERIRVEWEECAVQWGEDAVRHLSRENYPIEWAKAQSTLASAYVRRAPRPENYEQAIAHYEAALTVFTSETIPLEHLHTTHRLGEVLIRQRNWSSAAAVLADARKTFALLYGEGLEESEARELLELASGLFASSAYAVCELGRVEEAFELACQGRARFLAMALRLQRLVLPSERRQRLEALRTEIREQSGLLDLSSGIGRLGLLDRLASLRHELSGLIDETNDASRPVVRSLARAAAIVAGGDAIILPIATEIGGKLFIVTVDGLTVYTLPNLSGRRLKDFIHGTDDKLGWLDNFVPKLTRKLKVLVSKFSDDLWRLFDHPLGELLSPLGTEGEGSLSAVLSELGMKQGSRLMFLPTEGLGFLPLGLMGGQSSGRRLIDDYEIVYSPSLEAIDQSRPAHRKASLAAITNATGDLPNTKIEGKLVARTFPKAASITLDAETPEAALAALKDKSYWHFATHSSLDFADARRSALILKDGAKLTVETLLKAESLGQPRLVVLSACASGLYELQRAPEEFIGFASAFISMGAAAVLGTLWPVNDLAATLLIARFYELHRSGRQKLPPATALRQAQLWLRESSRSALTAYVERAARGRRLRAAEAQELIAAITSAGTGLETERFFQERPPPKPSNGDRGSGSERPFAHPIYWGGFILYGL
jgi:CHAT domain-containing protein